MTGWKARSHLEHGRWDEAAAAASAVIERPRVPNASTIGPLVVLGRLRARRGDGIRGSSSTTRWRWPRRRASSSGSGRWRRRAPRPTGSTGAPSSSAAETERALALAARNGDAWAAGELFVWRRRAGFCEEPPTAVAEPYRLELAGEPEAAARVWAELGCPYDAALARLESPREDELRPATTSSSGSARVSPPPTPPGSCASAGRATCAEGRGR